MSRIAVKLTVEFVPDKNTGTVDTTAIYHEYLQSYAEFDDLLDKLDNSGYFGKFEVRGASATLTVYSPVSDSVDAFVCLALDIVRRRATYKCS